MKKIILSMVLLSALSFSPAVVADNQTTPDKPTTPPPSGETIPVVIIKGQPRPILHAPAKGIPMTIETLDNGLRINIPFKEYPVTAEVEQLTTPFGYWTATFTDAASCEMPFDGTVGDYRLTLTTADNSTYTGYFTLE
ncbi:MAG: hypothetical protein K2M27_12155 [Muribaculaceae bacterium]|nr:hypothetical protein [Muribaculaceae bacterium]